MVETEALLVLFALAVVAFVAAEGGGGAGPSGFGFV